MFKPKKKANENAVKKDFFSKKDKLITKTYIREVEKVNEISFKVIERSEYYSDEIDKGEIMHLKTTKAISPIDFIKNEDELIIFCSRLNRKEFNKLHGRNIVGIALSERVNQINPELYNEAEKKFKLILKRNHAKIYAYIKNGKHLILQGSGNPSINAREEIYILQESKEIYNQLKSLFYA